jgi:hypothetical protein
MKFAWPVAVVVVAIAAMIAFHSQLSDLIGRIRAVGPTGIDLVTHVENLTINVESPSVEALQASRESVSKHAKQLLGMHPIALAYLIRSATCSLWNKAEIEKARQLDYLKEIKAVGLADVYTIDAADVRREFGGEGLQVVFSSKGKFMMMAFDVEPNPCTPHPAAIALQ